MPHTPLPIPETKPATELIDGLLVRKMSPYGLHARVQRIVASALGNWSDELGRGRVGTEWDFDLTPAGERTNRLVPDVAFLSYARVPYEDDEDAQVPVIAPDVAVEILSQGQTLENSHRRIAIFLACGAKLVVLIDPRAENAWLVDGAGVRVLGGDEAIEHPALPGFSLPLARCFERIPPGGRVGLGH
jgi:Uma2 family endonuclease